MPEHVSNRQIADLLITSFEGGINYWANQARIRVGDKFFSNVQLNEEPDLLNDATISVREFHDDDTTTTHELRMPDMRSGLELMRRKYPQHFASIIAENDDAITADVFMQCCIFYELKYG